MLNSLFKILLSVTKAYDNAHLFILMEGKKQYSYLTVTLKSLCCKIGYLKLGQENYLGLTV